jgi:hypothetical protein
MLELRTNLRPQILPGLEILGLQCRSRQERSDALVGGEALPFEEGGDSAVTIKSFGERCPLGDDKGLLAPTTPGGGEMALVGDDSGIGNVKGRRSPL